MSQSTEGVQTTGLAIAGFLVIATLLVMSGFGTKLLGRTPKAQNN